MNVCNTFWGQAKPPPFTGYPHTLLANCITNFSHFSYSLGFSTFTYRARRQISRGISAFTVHSLRK